MILIFGWCSLTIIDMTLLTYMKCANQFKIMIIIMVTQ